MKLLALALLLAWPGFAGAQLTLMRDGTGAPQRFAPSTPPIVKDLGITRGRDQLSATWRVESGRFPGADYRDTFVAFTAPKDGTAIQGLLINLGEGTAFAIYEPDCLLNSGKPCDMKSLGIHLDVKARTLRFTGARIANRKLSKGASPSAFPEYIVVDGVLAY